MGGGREGALRAQGRAEDDEVRNVVLVLQGVLQPILRQDEALRDENVPGPHTGRLHESVERTDVGRLVVREATRRRDFRGAVPEPVGGEAAVALLGQTGGRLAASG